MPLAWGIAKKRAMPEKEVVWEKIIIILLLSLSLYIIYSTIIIIIESVTGNLFFRA